MIQLLLCLAAAISPSLPPSLSLELEQLGVTEAIESVAYAADNRLQPAFRESVRIVFSPATQALYESMRVMECKNVAPEGVQWSCSDHVSWRINGASKIYIEGNEQLNAWIAQNPEKALYPYLALIDEVNAIYPQDRYDAPLSALFIGTDGAEAIFSRFGSGCRTSIKIRSSLNDAGVRMHLDLLSERSKCI